MDNSKGEDLKNKIIHEIEDSGFSLEVFASIVLNRNGWIVRPSSDYYDQSIHDYKETDIIAYKPGQPDNSISNILVIECKKSMKNPWVFIQQKRFGNLSENLNIVYSPPYYPYYTYLENTMNSHHYSKVPKCAYSFVPFTFEEKNPKLSKSIFHAKNQVLSAVSHLIDKDHEFYSTNRTNFKTFYYPIIVFDGILYSAIIDENTISLQEENHVLLSVERELSIKRPIYLIENQFKEQTYKPYLIDVIKKEYFETYLKNFQKYYDERLSDIKNSFKKTSQ